MGTTRGSCDAVELRVHGVAGGTAEKMLDHPLVVRVAGDSRAGFYRPRPDTGRAGGATEGVAVEAYRWGTLTAGAAVRTASMLPLLPFLLTNLSIWLRPRPAGRLDPLAALCRVLAGTLTAAFVLSMIGVSLDLVGWQCVPYERCREGRPYLSWLGALPTGPRLALLSLIPLLALRVIWGIGARSARAYEGFGQPPPHPSSPSDNLTTPGFWEDQRTPAWLRKIHLAIGAGTLDVSLLAGISPSDGAHAWLLLAPVIALLAWSAVLLCLPVPTSGLAARRVLLPLRAATVGVTLLILGYAVQAGDVQPVTGQLPGYEGGVSTLISAQAVLLVLLAAVTAERRVPTTTGSRPFFGGLATPIVAAASVMVGNAFAATLVFRVADQLDRGAIPGPVRPDPPGVGPLDPPVAYWWSALAGLAALMILGAGATLTYLLSRRRRRRLGERVVEQDYPDAPSQAAPQLATVRDTIARSHLTEELGPMLIAFFLISSLGLVTIAFDAVGLGPTRLVAEVTAQPTKTTLLAAYVTDGGVWIISLLVIGLIIVAYRSSRSAETRRTVATLYDIGVFWPRRIHPFAPPCYAARAVPELAKRVSGLAAGGKVVMSGHSHGSVLAAAVILQLPPDVVHRVALLTHGSPMARIYARLYPAYLGPQTLCELGERLDWRWRNLWRDTDPVGGPIFAGSRSARPPCGAAAAESVDIRLRDPRSVTIAPADTVPPPLERHWPYHSQTPYQASVRELTELIDPSTSAVPPT